VKPCSARSEGGVGARSGRAQERTLKIIMVAVVVCVG
jgi:hypothetical protein